MRFIPKRLRRTADASRGKVSWRSFIRNGLLVAGFFAFVYVALGLAADLAALQIPEVWEAKLFAWRAKARTSDTPEFRRAEAILARLTKEPGLRPLPYRLYLMKIKAPTAVAVPGGGIGVTEGLLKEVKSETGLAMVLAHELGHHHKRHAMRNLGRALLLQAAMSLFFSQGSSVMNASLKAAEAKHSQKWERDADEFGIRLVHKVYRDTDGVLEFFEMIHKKHETRGSEWSAFFASHPYTPKRITYLRSLQKRLDAEDPRPKKKRPPASSPAD